MLVVIVFLAYLGPWTFVVESQTTKGAQIPRCAEQLISAYDCLERLKSGDDVRMLEKRRDEIYDRCVRDSPEDCKTQRRSQDKCEHELLNDKFRAMQTETKRNITQCFKRYPPTARRANVAAAAPNMGMQQGWGQVMSALQEPSSMLSPDEAASPLFQLCMPTPEQLQCIQRETRFFEESAMDIMNRIQAMQRDCLATTQMSATCRLDNSPQLRECIRVVNQAYSRKSAAAIDDCMQNMGKNSTAVEEEEEETSDE